MRAVIPAFVLCDAPRLVCSRIFFRVGAGVVFVFRVCFPLFATRR